jgi:hypothetical protein
MPFKSNGWAPEAYAYIRTHWPYMNRSIAAGQTRHFITHTCDQGPSSCEYAERPLTEGKVPAFWNPAAKDRVVGARRAAALRRLLTARRSPAVERAGGRAERGAEDVPSVLRP